MLLFSSPFSLLLLAEYLLKHTGITLYLLNFSEAFAFRVKFRLLRLFKASSVPFHLSTFPGPECLSLSASPSPPTPFSVRLVPQQDLVTTFSACDRNLSCFLLLSATAEVICVHVFCY